MKKKSLHAILLYLLISILLPGMALTGMAGEHPTSEHPSSNPKKNEHPRADASKSEHPKSNVHDQADILGVLFYADWCGSCKTLDPKLEATKSVFKNKGIHFTRLDLTNDLTKTQAAEQAEALGIQQIYQIYQNRTGFMLLVDNHDQQILETLTANMTKDQLRGAMQAALSKAGKGTPRPSEHPGKKSEHPSKKSEHPSKKSEHPSRSEHPHK